MQDQGVVLSALDVSVLSYLVQEITHTYDGTDTTELLWQNGSIHGTIPATPEKLRGSELFKQLKHLPPERSFSGTMKLHRQGGVVKGYSF